MRRPAAKNPLLYLGLLAALLAVKPAAVRAAEVVARIQIQSAAVEKKEQAAKPIYAALWLTPLPGTDPPSRPPQSSGHYRLVQHNKQFIPHLLVVPVGSSVDFPNRDPFYHNVFSQFNGKRFDLGLYESGSSRAVRFDHEGVSYIFCNIHPEMGAVVIALGTPYFAVASPDGAVTIRDVPAGAYELSVWVEGSSPAELKSLGRRVQVASGEQDLGLLRVHTEVHPMEHKNKFGEDYAPADVSPY
jgi:plastocyanin